MAKGNQHIIKGDAQDVENRVLRPSGLKARERRIKRAVQNVDTSDAALAALIERGASLSTAALRQAWVVDVCQYLLAVRASK